MDTINITFTITHTKKIENKKGHVRLIKKCKKFTLEKQFCI